MAGGLKFWKGAEIMAKLHHTENGTPWLEITCEELSGYSRMERPVCDECLKSGRAGQHHTRPHSQ